MSETQHIVCPICGGRNRVLREKAADAGKCGRCRGALFTHAPVELGNDAFDKHVPRTNFGTGSATASRRSSPIS